MKKITIILLLCGLFAACNFPTNQADEMPEADPRPARHWDTIHLPDSTVVGMNLFSSDSVVWGKIKRHKAKKASVPTALAIGITTSQMKQAISDATSPLLTKINSQADSIKRLTRDLASVTNNHVTLQKSFNADTAAKGLLIRSTQTYDGGQDAFLQRLNTRLYYVEGQNKYDSTYIAGTSKPQFQSIQSQVDGLKVMYNNTAWWLDPSDFKPDSVKRIISIIRK